MTRSARLAVYIILVAISTAAMLVFASLDFGAIIAVLAGAVLVVAGLLNSYKPAAVVGMLLASIGAASAIQINTLTEASTLVTAIIGLFLPVIVLSWLALSAEEEIEIRIGRRPSLVTSAYAIVCLFSVPIVVLIGGLIQPAIATRISTMTELAIALFVSAAGAVALTSGTLPSPKAENVAEEEETEE